MRLPERFKDLSHLHEWMTQPDPSLIEAMKTLEGDLIILGAGGKMGSSLAVLAKRALEESRSVSQVIAVSRFSNAVSQQYLHENGVKTIACDLMNPSELAQLPTCKYVIFMAGTKFGTTGNEAQTWAINSFLPGLVAQQFSKSKIVVFSTGNVYPLSPVSSGGSKEIDRTSPIGEYAQSTLGRERVFEYFSHKLGTPTLIFRLNYAIDMQYGVLLDIAQKVKNGKAINLQMGYVNVIWQRDANAYALKAIHLTDSPPSILNVTGMETLSVRELASTFGEIFQQTPVFEGKEQETALLSNATLCHDRLGGSAVSVEDMIRCTANWILDKQYTHNKPTRYEAREGKF